MRQGQMRQRQMHPKLHLKFWQQHRCLVGEFIFEDTGSQPLPVVALELGHTTSIAWYCMFLNPGASQCFFQIQVKKMPKKPPFMEAAPAPVSRQSCCWFSSFGRLPSHHCWWTHCWTAGDAPNVFFWAKVVNDIFSVLSCNWILLVEIG